MNSMMIFYNIKEEKRQKKTSFLKYYCNKQKKLFTSTCSVLSKLKETWTKEMKGK